MTTMAPPKSRKTRKDKGKPKELSEAHKRKMQEGRERRKREQEKDVAKQTRDAVKRLRDQVEKAKVASDKATAKLEAAGGAKRAGDMVFNDWLRADANLLNLTTALKAHEARSGNDE